MLSPDELTNGMTFILQLHETDGKQVQWVETLRGDTAKRWYDIYHDSNWPALQAEALDIFHRRVSETEAASVLNERRRCIFIHTPAVSVDALDPGHGSN